MVMLSLLALCVFVVGIDGTHPVEEKWLPPKLSTSKIDDSYFSTFFCIIARESIQMNIILS